MNAPIVLFTYARPDHTRRTVEALQRNQLAKSSDLIVFSDGARTPDKITLVDEVRAYIDKIDGFNSVTCHYRPYNYGLSKSIIEGVSQVLNDYERIIVLEDDLVTSPYFLTYMNDALEYYAEDDRVISIHGYVYPVQEALPETFFLVGADCWGWATWQRGWKLFNPNGQVLFDELTRQGLLKEFDYNGAYGFSKMLQGQVAGTNDSWAVRWYASAFLANKLTLYPGRSLVCNIGQDNSGTHSRQTMAYESDLSLTPISIGLYDVRPSLKGKAAFESFFRRVEGGQIKKLVQMCKLLANRIFI